MEKKTFFITLSITLSLHFIMLSYLSSSRENEKKFSQDNTSSRTLIKISNPSPIKNKLKTLIKSTKESIKKTKTDQTKEAILISHINPDYPWRARKLRLEGFTTLKFTITTRGTVKEIQIIKSSGHSILDTEAVKALSGASFTPKKSKNKKVESRMEMSFNFSIDE